MLRLADLGPGGLRTLLAAEQERTKASARKHSASQRLLIDARRHKQILRAYVMRSYGNKEIREEILKHVTVLKNLQLEVTDEVAVAYLRPPTRVLREVEDDQAQAFAAAYREADTDALAEQWARQAFFLGVVHVLPRYEQDEGEPKGKLSWVTVTPDSADVLFDEQAGEGEPSILIYETTAHGAALVAVDGERWWWISENWAIVHEEEHDLGARPWVTWRWRTRPAADYWDQGQGEDLYEATLEIGRLQAHYKWVRMSYSKKTETLAIDENTHLPEGQNIGLNQPLMSKGGLMTYGVHDTIVGPAFFLEEQAELVDSIRHAYGLPSRDVVSTGSAEAQLVKREAQIKIRDRSIKMFDRSETELAARATMLLRRHGRVSLDPEQVREALDVRFSALSFADTPTLRVEAMKAMAGAGQTNKVEFYMAENPGTTFEEAKERVFQNIEIEAEINAKLTSYNLSLTPETPADDSAMSNDGENGVLSPAQRNGMIGGVASGVARAPGDATETTP